MSPFPSDSVILGFERSLAVVIGINAYARGVPPLQNAARDAAAVADALQRQGFEVLRFLDSEASLAALSALLSTHLPSLQPPPDRLLLYFAGHGLAHTDEQNRFSGFLLPVDARRDEPSSYWSMDSLRQGLGQLPCRHLLLILDCCFAGAFPQAAFRDLRPPQPHAPLFLERFRHFSSRRSFQVLLSTAHDELASDRLVARSTQDAVDSGLHSPFTRALLEALQPSSPADTNQDGLLTASEIYTFLRDRLLTLQPSPSPQTPSLRHVDWHDGGEFLFLLDGAFPALPSASPLSKQSNPYLGLRPFSSEHRRLFFGRERVIDSLLEHLHSQPLLVLCAPSGAGKSSLVHAGLVPRLQEQSSWTVPPALRPSSQPFQQLSSWLSSLLPGSSAPSSDELAATPQRATDFLRMAFSLDSTLSAALIVDPLEELVTACLDGSARQSFLHALASLLQLGHPRFRLLLLLRADFEPHFVSLLSASPGFQERWREARFLLPPMNREELRLCIQKPAEAFVVFFSSSLVERLLDDVDQMPGALPLLSVALSELFDAYLDSGRVDRTLSFEDYERLGSGIAGALQRRAELVFTGAPPPSWGGEPSLTGLSAEALPAFQRTLRNVLLRMVSPEGGELARRRVFRVELEYPHPEENARVQRALAALEASRLVVASDDGGPCVEPAHDALLSAWPRLHDWARQAQHELLLLRRVSQAASEWLRQRQTVTFLWADARLEQLGLSSAFLRDPRHSLSLSTSSASGQPSEPLAFNTSESHFLRSSAARHHQLRLKRYALTLAVAVCLLTLTIAALFNANQAQRQKEAALASAFSEQQAKETALNSVKEAEQQKTLVLMNARLIQAQRLLDEDPTKALLALREISPTAEDSLSTWLQLAVNVSFQPVSSALLLGHTSGITQATFSPDGSRVLTVSNDGTARIWRSDGHGEPLVLKVHPAKLTSAAFSPDGSHVLTASDDGTVRICRSDGHGEPLILKGHSLGRTSATFNPDGSRVLTTSWDGTARIWRSDGHGESLVLEGLAHGPTSASFSPDGSHVLTVSDDGNARIWRSDGRGEPLVLKGHSRVRTSTASSPDGSRIPTTCDDGTGRIWPSNGRGGPLIIKGLSIGITSAAFSPDGSRVLVTCTDDTARIWPSNGRSEPLVLRGHSDSITSIAFSPDGSRVLTASDDGTARIWYSDGRGEPLVLRGHSRGLTSASFSPDGSRVLTASDDGTARIWYSDGHGEPLVLRGHSNRIRSTAFSPDGSRVLTASDDGTARIWYSDGHGEPLVLRGHSNRIRSTAFSPDGSHVLTASDDGTSLIWRSDGRGEPLVLRGHSNWIGSAAFSPDGSHVLTASLDGTARIWRSDGRGEPLVLKCHSRFLISAAFSPDGSRVLTACADGTSRIWRSDGRSEPLDLRGHSRGRISATFSPDGSRVLTASLEGTSHILYSDGRSEPLVLRGHSDNLISAAFSPDVLPISAAFSPDGSRVLILSRGTAHIWYSDGHGEPLVLRGHSDSLTSAAFSPDGSRVLTASLDGTARIWHSDGRGEPLVIKGLSRGFNSPSFSPDGSRVLTVSNDGNALIWRSDSRSEPLVVLRGLSNRIGSAAFSPDGSHVLTASDDGTSLIWRSDGRGEPLAIKGLSRTRTSAAFSPDGSYVALGYSNGRFHVVPIAPTLFRESFRTVTTSCLSAADRERYLLESPDKAREENERCQRAYDRSPEASLGDSSTRAQ